MNTIPSTSRVTYTDRSGKPCAVTLPGHMVTQYVKNLGERVAKSVTVSPVETVLSVNVQACPVGDETAQREASNLRWKREMQGMTYVTPAAQAAYDAEARLLRQWEATKAERAERIAQWEAAKNLDGFEGIDSAILAACPAEETKASDVAAVLAFHRALGLRGDPHTGDVPGMTGQDIFQANGM